MKAVVLVAISLLTLSPVLTHAEDFASFASQSRFQRTVAHLQSEPGETSAAFAVVALGLLAEAYSEEAGLALKESEGSREEGELRGWAAAVERYSRQFSMLIEDVELGFPVTFTILPAQPVSVTIADRTVILTHPRLVYQAEFEQRVLQAFCSRRSCEAFSSPDVVPAPIPMSAGSVRPVWQFSSEGPVCAYAGLEIHFSAQADLAQARALCGEVLAEASFLAREIAWQIRHAVVVNWRDLQLFDTPGRTEHRLQLNGAGDIVLARVPVIFRSAGLLEHLSPWLRHRAEGAGEYQVVVQAVEFGWN